MHAPRKIGDYTLIRLLGRGGMAEVWLAQCGDLEKPFVVKLLLPQFSGNADYRRRFLREARIVASLSHTRIVSVVNYGECDGRLFLVMGFVDGVNLQVLCSTLAEKGQRLQIEIIVYILAEILEALRHAHSHIHRGKRRTIVHRDVKPANVLISSQGEVFLVDFGIALHDNECSLDVMGTMNYMAPEQARNDGWPRPQTDLYGLGGIAHYLLTGNAPRQATNAVELVATLDDPPPPTGRTDVPAQLEALRTAALDPNQKTRIANAEDCQALIEGCGGDRDRSRRKLREMYLLFIRGPRSGMSEMLPKAEQPPVEPVAPTLPMGPSSSSSPQWGRPWWNKPPTRPAADMASVPEEYRPQPKGDVETDAPRVLRRPRGTVDGAPRQAPEPGIPAVTDTVAFPPPLDERQTSDDASGNSEENGR